MLRRRTSKPNVSDICASSELGDGHLSPRKRFIHSCGITTSYSACRIASPLESRRIQANSNKVGSAQA